MRHSRGLLALCAFLPVPLVAQVGETFAQFQQATGNNSRPFVFDHQGASATFNTADIVTGTEVEFDFKTNPFSGILASLNNTVQARMIMVSQTASLAQQLTPTLINQRVDSGFIEFRALVPVDNRDLLLRVDFTHAELNVLFNSLGSFVALDYQNSATLAYSSEFLLFSGAYEGLSISLSGINPPTSIAGGFLSDFSANVTGMFDGQIAAVLIPEPSSAVTGLALAGLLGAIWWRRRTAS